MMLKNCCQAPRIAWAFGTAQQGHPAMYAEIADCALRTMQDHEAIDHWPTYSYPDITVWWLPTRLRRYFVISIPGMMTPQAQFYAV